jgi:hypothetical protein
MNEILGFSASRLHIQRSGSAAGVRGHGVCEYDDVLQAAAGKDAVDKGGVEGVTGAYGVLHLDRGWRCPGRFRTVIDGTAARSELHRDVLRRSREPGGKC